MEERRTALRLGLMHINRAHVLDHPATYLPFGDPNNRYPDCTLLYDVS